jgi:cytochrome P450
MEPELLKERSLELAPFGGGARLCPGMQLSLTEQKIALIELIKAYRFTQTDADQDVGSRYQFTVVPENLRVNVAARTETVSCSKVESVVPA